MNRSRPFGKLATKCCLLSGLMPSVLTIGIACSLATLGVGRAWADTSAATAPVPASAPSAADNAPPPGPVDTAPDAATTAAPRPAQQPPDLNAVDGDGPATTTQPPPSGAAQSVQAAQSSAPPSASPATTAIAANNPPISTIPADSALPPGSQPRGHDSNLQGNRSQTPSNENDPNQVYVEHAQSVHLDSDNIAVAEGDVRIRFRDYLITSDRVAIDTKTNVATFSGNAKITSRSSALLIHAKDPSTEIIVDLTHGIYTVKGSEAGIIPPEMAAASGVILPIYLEGGYVHGTSTLIDMRQTGVTTCDFPNPHYLLVSDTVTIRPGKRLVARHVKVYRRGHRIFTIPLIVLPLDDRYQRQQYAPQLGVSPDEGYFAKFAVPYALTASAVGLARIDFMQRKGIGYGFDQAFQVGPPVPASGATPAFKGNQGGVFKVYSLKDMSLNLQTFTASLTDAQRLPWDVDLRVDSQFANNSYYLSQTKSSTFTNNVTMTRSVGNSLTTLNTNVQSSQFGSTPTGNLSSNLDERLNLPANSSADLKVGYTESTAGSTTTGTGTDQESMTTDFDYRSPSNRLVQFELSTDTITSIRNIIGGAAGESSLGGVERFPELKITASPVNGQQNPLLRFVPLINYFTFDVGDYNDTSARESTQRLLFNLGTGSQTHKKKRLATTYLGDFEQDFYGDGAARYILNYTYGTNYTVGPRSNFTINYAALRPFGYTPFFFDNSGTYNNASANLTYTPTRKIQFVVASGYDFTQSHSMDGLPAVPWQNLSVQMVVKPNGTIVDKLVSTYNPNSGELFSLSDEVHIGLPWGFAFDTAALYSPTTYEFSTITGNLTVPIMTDKAEQAGYTLQALAGYNGYTKQITYEGFDLTRSWHDYELSGIMQENLSGTPGTTFYLNFRLKAFPGYQPFAVGQFGQGLDSSIGTIL